jgi:hypothetical protein
MAETKDNKLNKQIAVYEDTDQVNELLELYEKNKSPAIQKEIMAVISRILNKFSSPGYEYMNELMGFYLDKKKMYDLIRKEVEKGIIKIIKSKAENVSHEDLLKMLERKDVPEKIKLEAVSEIGENGWMNELMGLLEKKVLPPKAAKKAVQVLKKNGWKGYEKHLNEKR